LLTLAGNLNNQAVHFGAIDTCAPMNADTIAALDANEDLLLVDPLAADYDDKDANPEIVACRALVIHPKIGLLFVQPKAPHRTLHLVQQIHEAVPAPFQGRLGPLLDFAHVAIMANTAGRDVSTLHLDWQHLDHGTSPALITWYCELVGTCSKQYVLPPAAPAATLMHVALPILVDPALGIALQQLANSTNIIVVCIMTKYKDHKLEELFQLCNIPIDVDCERDESDLPLFWVDFHKHRGKVNDAHSYIEHHFDEHYPKDGALDSMVFSHHFIQDMMGHNLYGRDRMIEFANHFCGFSIFLVGPIDFNFNAGESQHQEFVLQESAKLKLDETMALEKKSNKIMEQLISWPKNLLEWCHCMEHMHYVCQVFFGNAFTPGHQFYDIYNYVCFFND